jgi:hypothetical protein
MQQFQNILFISHGIRDEKTDLKSCKNQSKYA